MQRRRATPISSDLRVLCVFVVVLVFPCVLLSLCALKLPGSFSVKL